MENEQVNQQELQEVKVTPEVKAYFVEAANWGTFLAILGYLGIALLVILAILTMTMGGKLFETFGTFDQYYGMQEGVQDFRIGAVISGIFTLFIAVLYFFPVYYLHQFSSKVKHGVNSFNQETFALGVKNLKSLFKFMGIVTVIVFAFYVLALVFVLLGVAIAG